VSHLPADGHKPAATSGYEIAQCLLESREAGLVHTVQNVTAHDELRTPSARADGLEHACHLRSIAPSELNRLQLLGTLPVASCI
jgi:hypothetical protein